MAFERCGNKQKGSVYISSPYWDQLKVNNKTVLCYADDEVVYV